MKSPHNEGGLPRERSRRGKANSKSASALLLELQEHVKGKCHLTHGLDGLGVGSFLHENRVLECNSDVVGVQVAVQRKRALWDSCTTPLLSFPTLPSSFAAGVASAFSALHHMWKAGCKQGKKSVGSWFVAESAPLGGELS